MSNVTDLRLHKAKADYITKCINAKDEYIHRQILNYLGPKVAMEITNDINKLKDYDTPELRAFIGKLNEMWDQTWARRK